MTRANQTQSATKRVVAKKPSAASHPGARATKPATRLASPELLPELRFIPLDTIELPRRPVRRFLGDVAALAESMQEYGLQQPISVRATGEDRYLLTSGLRRLQAAGILGWGRILAFVRTVNADQAYLLDLIENLQREDLSAEEEADAFGELVRTRGWTLQQVAEAVKRSIGYVSRRVRIFEDPRLREAVVVRGLPVSTAEVLLSAESEVRLRLIDRALAEGWDQGHARVALRASERVQVDVQAELVDAQPDDSGVAAPRPVQAVERAADVGPSRPPGFTRAVREFHRVIMVVQPEDLSAADRSALRALFRDLVLLARAASTPAPRVFPPLPGGG